MNKILLLLLCLYTTVQVQAQHFEDDFSSYRLGTMPSQWITHGTGSVESIPGVPGQWFALSPSHTYKIKEPVALPEKFTLSFDIFARAATGLRFELDFGFDYQKGITHHYFLGSRNPLNIRASYQFNSIEVSSRELGSLTRSAYALPMQPYANGILHVKMIIDGEQLRVYLDNTKIVDAALLDPKTKKYFYLALQNEQKDAQVYISNVKISR